MAIFQRPFWQKKGHNTQPTTKSAKKRYGGTIALGVAVLVLFITSCSSLSGLIQQNTTNEPQTDTSQQSSTYQTDNNDDDYRQSEQSSETTTPEPAAATLNVDPIPDKTIDIPSYSEVEYNAESAKFLTYSGKISKSGQKKSYKFTASETGVYRCELSDMVNGFTVSMYVYDSKGNIVDRNFDISNGYGVTVSLAAGKSYTLSIESYSGTGSYKVFIGMQKSTVDLSKYTIVHDATEYKWQEIKYSYSPAIDGVYRFYIAQINNGITVDMYVYDSSGYIVDRNINIGQDYGVTVTLNAGQTYTVVIKQSSDVGKYTMNIGPQKPTVDITDYTLVADSTMYSNQTNNYSFTAKENGVYRFQIDKINNGITVDMYVYDAAGYIVDRNINIGQDSGVTVTLDAGKTYTVVIKQSSNYGAYTMSVGSQKKSIDISAYNLVKDSIQYSNQENNYVFRPSRSGSFTFRVDDVVSGMAVSIYVYDDANYLIDSYTDMNSGNTLSVDLEANKTYHVQVKYSSNYGMYTLSVA